MNQESATALPHADGDGPSPRRVLRAFLIAPLSAPAGYAGFALVTISARALFGSASLSSMRGLREVVIAVAWLGIPVAYGAALVVGVPIYLVLRRFGRIGPTTLWLSGALSGALVAFLLAPLLHGELFSIRFPLWAGSLLGMLTAEVFRRLLESPDTERHGRVAG